MNRFRCMARATGFAISMWLAGTGGCGGEESRPQDIQIADKPPAEASALAADAFCKNEVMCGTAGLSCTGGTNVATTCEVIIRHPVYADCYDEVRPDIEELLSCPALTSVQRQMIEACINALARRPCVSQADADATARAAEVGVYPPPMPRPPECALVLQPLPGCP